MLTGYTDWRGKGLFFDSNINVGYGDLSGHRFINIGGISREASSKRGSEMAGGGFHHRRDPRLWRHDDPAAIVGGRHGAARRRL